MKIRISPNDVGSPIGKLADAELHFDDGPLAGLKLIGFAVWERRDKSGRNVTFPARQYTVSGERRSFALLRPIMEPKAQDHIRDLILSAYAAWEHRDEEPQAPTPNEQAAAREPQAQAPSYRSTDAGPTLSPAAPIKTATGASYRPITDAQLRAAANVVTAPTFNF